MRDGNNSDDEKETGNDVEADKTPKSWGSGGNKLGKKVIVLIVRYKLSLDVTNTCNYITRSIVDGAGVKSTKH